MRKRSQADGADRGLASAITNAVRRASEHAPVELKSAQDKLDQATAPWSRKTTKAPLAGRTGTGGRELAEKKRSRPSPESGLVMGDDNRVLREEINRKSK